MEKILRKVSVEVERPVLADEVRRGIRRLNRIDWKRLNGVDWEWEVNSIKPSELRGQFFQCQGKYI